MKNFLLMFFSSMGISFIVGIVSYKFGLSQGTALLYGLLTMMIISSIGMTMYARSELRDEELEKLHKRISKDKPPFFLVPAAVVLITLVLSALAYAFDLVPLLGHVLLSAIFATIISFIVYIHYYFKEENFTATKSTSLRDYCMYSAKSLGCASKE